MTDRTAATQRDRTDRPERLRADVETLAAHPRGRRNNSEHLEAARAYVADELTSAGWHVDRQPFTVPAGVGMSDAVRPSAKWWPIRPRRSVAGVNLIATAGGSIDDDTLLVVAHLDSVRRSPGADDNASGVAAAIELAHALRPSFGPGMNVAIGIVDLEAIGLAGARHLASSTRPGALLNLEAVGYYTAKPGTQKLPPGAALVAPSLVRQVKDRQGCADFALVVHRPNSAALAREWVAAAAAAGRLSRVSWKLRWRSPA